MSEAERWGAWLRAQNLDIPEEIVLDLVGRRSVTNAALLPKIENLEALSTVAEALLGEEDEIVELIQARLAVLRQTLVQEGVDAKARRSEWEDNDG